jgi:RDD family
VNAAVQVQPDRSPAGFFQRLAAWLIDYVILAVAMGLIFGLTAEVFSGLWTPYQGWSSLGSRRSSIAP